MTQSSWSHAAIFVDDAVHQTNDNGETLSLIEADIIEGVRAVPLREYESIHARICRPVGLDKKEIMHIRHHSLFAPRDFDVSPYFNIIKPTLKQGFNFHDVKLEPDTNTDKF